MELEISLKDFKCERLGNYNPLKKARPLVVKLSSKDDALKLIKNDQLHPPGTYFTFDRTKMQRLAYKKVREEMIKHNSRFPLNKKIIKYVDGEPTLVEPKLTENTANTVPQGNLITFNSTNSGSPHVFSTTAQIHASPALDKRSVSKFKDSPLTANSHIHTQVGCTNSTDETGLRNTLPQDKSRINSSTNQKPIIVSNISPDPLFVTQRGGGRGSGRGGRGCGRGGRGGGRGKNKHNRLQNSVIITEIPSDPIYNNNYSPDVASNEHSQQMNDDLRITYSNLPREVSDSTSRGTRGSRTNKRKNWNNPQKNLLDPILKRPRTY